MAVHIDENTMFFMKRSVLKMLYSPYKLGPLSCEKSCIVFVLHDYLLVKLDGLIFSTKTISRH